MNVGPDTLHVVITALAVWRMTHLLAREDGPGDVVFKLRRALGDSVIGRALDCFYCLSLWVAAPFGALLAQTFSEFVVLWLGLSGVTCLLERSVPPTVLTSAPAPSQERTPEGDQS